MNKFKGLQKIKPMPNKGVNGNRDEYGVPKVANCGNCGENLYRKLDKCRKCGVVISWGEEHE